MARRDPASAERDSSMAAIRRGMVSLGWRGSGSAAQDHRKGGTAGNDRQQGRPRVVPIAARPEVCWLRARVRWPGAAWVRRVVDLGGVDPHPDDLGEGVLIGRAFAEDDPVALPGLRHE